jgi:hypothetical protein
VAGSKFARDCADSGSAGESSRRPRPGRSLTMRAPS